MHICTYGTLHVSMCVQAGGQGARVYVSLCRDVIGRYAFLMCMPACHVRVRGRPVLALCMLGLPVYRKYCEARRKRWSACSSDEAHTLWCVLSLQWRGSSKKVQKKKTAEESRHCFYCLCLCVVGVGGGGGLLCASTTSTSS